MKKTLCILCILLACTAIFCACDTLSSVTFGNKEGWSAGTTALSSTELQSTSTAATYLTSTYYTRVWTRTQP